MGFLLQIRMSWLRFRKGVGAGAGVVVLGAGAVRLSVRLRRGGAISWPCRLRTFLLQPVACQQVVGFCLAIWVYAGVIFSEIKKQQKQLQLKFSFLFIDTSPKARY